MRQLVAYESANPFRRPDWRCDRAVTMATGKIPRPDRPTARDDWYVREYRKFLLRYNNAPDPYARQKLCYVAPGLYWAHEINEKREDGAFRKAALIEARILAREDDAAIAANWAMPPSVVEWYEALFFNVRDRLRAHDWLVDHVLMPAFTTARDGGVAGNGHGGQYPLSEPYFDPTMKWFGYFGGRLVLDFIIAGFNRGSTCPSREEVGDWFDGHFSVRLKQRSTSAMQTFEVNRYNVMQLFELHNQLVTIERGTEGNAKFKDQYSTSVRALMDGMKWAVGAEGAELVHGTAIEAYDQTAAELRDGELGLLHAGRVPATIEGMSQLTLPPPSEAASAVSAVAVAEGGPGGERGG